MNKRTRCNVCQYPTVTCVCHAVSEVKNQTSIVVLQHPTETKHAKNTVRLLQLCLSNIDVHIGEKESDFADIKAQLMSQQQNVYLVYPKDDSQPLETLKTFKQPMTLVLLDGSWKKAYKLLQLNPWLNRLPTISFSAVAKSRYVIRKANRSDSLSTLEAVGLCLEHLEQCDTSALYRTFEAMIDGQWRFMDNEVKSRY